MYLKQQLCSSALTLERALFPDIEVKVSLLLFEDNAV